MLLGVIRHQAWTASDQPALAWNVAGSFVTCCLLLMVARGGWFVRAVVLWWLYEEALVMGCSLWRMVDWWGVPAGAEQCSARLGVQLGAVSLAVIAWLAAWAAWTTPNNKGGHDES